MSVTTAPQPVASPHVLILMAVYNGAPYLPEQIDSLKAQSHTNWSLLASDDASHDASREILASAREARVELHLLDGPCAGAAANFLSLLRRAAPYLKPDSWIAFCDQDDVWFPDRLSMGLARLMPVDPQTPAMVFNATLIAAQDLSGARSSPPRPKPPGFRNALVQNIAAGNTILLNPAAAALACAAASEVDAVVMHDWWLYQLITGAGGIATHDDRPALYYRQHGANEIGANDGPLAKAQRMKMLISGRFRDWNRINLSALEASSHRFTPENRRLLAQFRQMHEGGVLARLHALSQARLYRQSRLSTLALWFAALIGRI